jgi:hypothetical protein
MKQNPTPIHLKTTTPRFLIAIALALGCFALLPTPNALGVVPAPDGGYPGFNTAEGQNALLHLTTGTANTAVGWVSLENVTTGSFNTGVGAGTLVLNSGDQNTATGVAALLLNTTGDNNTANGTLALLNNTEGSFNTANGANALNSNTTGDNNTANGTLALSHNTTGNNNTAVGRGALINNTTGGGNIAVGFQTLVDNTTGGDNVAIGYGAGANQTTGGGNIYIGEFMSGVAGENNACYIGSIFQATSATGIPVLINSNHKLGTTTSSKRFKEDIKPMDKTSEALFSLKPVTFRYKKEIDPARTAQLGLVAEEVEKVNPDLVVRDKEGKPYSVRYEQVNAMLLNEFLKEHRKVQQQETTIAQLKSTLAKKETIDAHQQEQIEALTAACRR